MYKDYEKIVGENLLLPEELWNFKSNGYYNRILEHVNEKHGNKYLEILNNNIIFSTEIQYIIDLCKKNDLFGKPIKYNFKNFCSCSPTNLRYILHSILILEHIIKCDMNNVDIIEIGGGYGGLAFFMHNLAGLYKIKIKSYTIFDLDNVMLLQKKYLSLFDIDINIININDNFSLNEKSFLISNYAFSEISHEFQQLYINKVISKYIIHGFMTWNFIDVYNFTEKKITKEIEYPMTGNDKNYYVYF